MIGLSIYTDYSSSYKPLDTLIHSAQFEMPLATPVRAFTQVLHATRNVRLDPIFPKNWFDGPWNFGPPALNFKELDILDRPVCTTPSLSHIISIKNRSLSTELPQTRKLTRERKRLRVVHLLWLVGCFRGCRSYSATISSLLSHQWICEV